MAEDQAPTPADQARAENAALLDGFWCRAVESLVAQGIPWNEAATSMLSVAALQVEAAVGLDIAERSLDGARKYMAGKREASERLDVIVREPRSH